MNTHEAKRVLETALICAQQPLPLRDMRSLFDDQVGADTLRTLLDELVLSLLSLNPLARPSNAAEVIDRLAALAPRLVAYLLLQALVDSWQGSGPEPGLACSLDLAWHADDGQAQPWPRMDDTQALWLPRALWLALYRISQEALTNVARHADARRAGLRLRLQGGRQPGDALQVDWQAWDDGVGLPPGRAEGSGPWPQAEVVLSRGNGLAGLQERVWAQGGTLHSSPLQPGAARQGLCLAASFHTRLLPPPATD